MNDYFQLSSVDPAESGRAQPVASNIFCFGDVARTSLKNVKTIPAMKWMAPYIYQNIIAVGTGKQPSAVIPSTLPTVCVVSLGPDYGLMNLNGIISLNNKNGKMKFQVTADSINVMKGDLELAKKKKKELNGIKSFLSCMTCMCCCCPCSNCYTVVEKRKQ